MPKQSATHPTTASIQTNTTSPQSGMIHDPSTLTPGALAISNVLDAQQQVPNPHHPHVDPIANEVHGGKEVCQEKLLDRQERGPKGVGIPHVLHECATAQSTDHRLDSIPPATTDPPPVNHATQPKAIDMNEEQGRLSALMMTKQPSIMLS
ncbi:hypothetical protein A4A49_00314 [Nicotiana attenuata]|uniref:Uncharacterized protein n=1 Tax=Nicotiana attenuata TaxID=49451 RepID=A0A1J6IHH8_NICAT|nr:hypothetical protein A4A49_00314 [Nicotiana attenuata]